MTTAFPSSFHAALSAAGISYSGPVQVNSVDKFNRFRPDGYKNEDGWYKVWLRGDVYYACFGDWKRGINEKWCSKQNLTGEERRQQNKDWAEIKADVERVQEEKWAKTRAMLAEYFPKWPKATDHPYLANKKLKPRGDVRLCTTGEARKGWLVVPLYDAAGTLQTVQFIAEDGTKTFQGGGKQQGCYFPITDLKPGPKTLVEGYATGISVADATGWTTFCAFNCGNLMAVAKAMRKAFPDDLIIVAGDDDHIQSCRSCKADVDLDIHPTYCPHCSKEHLQVNAGVTKGTEAAKAVKGLFMKPNFPKR